MIPFEDSLYAFHAFSSHLPMRLDMLTSIYCDASPWKIKHGRRGASVKQSKTEEMTGEELCHYNCLEGRVPVVLADGSTRQIKNLVNGRFAGEVLSLSAAGKIEAKRVIGWSRSRVEGQKWWRIQTNRRDPLVTTPDHKILTARGWLEARLVQEGDELFLARGKKLIATVTASGPYALDSEIRYCLTVQDNGNFFTTSGLVSNSADCRVTIRNWRGMKKDLATERRTYDHDLCLLDLCADMEHVGVRVDVSRQKELSSAMEIAAEGYRDEIRKIVGDPTMKLTPNNIRDSLYRILAVKKLHFTETGLPATGKIVIESLKSEDTPAGRFATNLSKWREVRKIKKTYVDFPLEIMFPLGGGSLYGRDPARAHYSWGPRERRNQPTVGGGHTVSGRLACRLQSMPRYNPKNLADRAREIYIPSPGNVFTYFDVSQGEPRVAAFLSGDPERIKTTLGDVHAENAKIMFPEAAARGWLDGDAKKDPTRGKPIRDLAKTMGLAIDYFAEADTTFQYVNQNRFDPNGKALFGPQKLGTIAAIISKIRFRYRVYVKYVMQNLQTVQRTGFMRSPVLGRIRWFGWYPSITFIANYPVQSTLADVMNLRCLFLQGHPRFFAFLRKYPELAERVSLPKKPIRLPRGVTPVAQVHDSVFYDTPKREQENMRSILLEIWSGKIYLPGGELILPIDCKFGERFSEL
jgi:DNA polymerase family A